MTYRRNRRTDLALVASGDWAKVGRHTYRHSSGGLIRYNSRRYLWELPNGDGYGTLEIAAYSYIRDLSRLLEATR